MDAKAKLLQVMERTFQVPSSKFQVQSAFFTSTSTNLVLCFLLKEKALNLLTSTNLRFVRRFVLVRFAL